MLGKRLINSNDAASGVCASDEVDIFGDSSGLALYQLNWDSSDIGGNYNGTSTDITFSNGKIDDAANFNGSSSCVNLPTGVDRNNNFTLSVWANFNTLADYDSLITLQKNYRIYLNVMANGSLDFFDGATLSSSAGVVTTGNWYNIVVTKSSTLVGGKAIIIYVNGTEVASSNRTTNAPDADNAGLNLLGAYNAASASNFFYLDGKMDQVRIFSKALSSTEVTTLSNEAACDKTCTTDTPQLVSDCIAYYKLDGNTNDSNGTATVYDGTPSNVSFVGGRFRSAGSFNGSSSEISLGSSNSFSYTTTGALSINMWIKTTSTTTGYVISKANDSDTNYEWAIEQLSNGTLTLYAYNNADGVASTINNTAVINDGNWHNLVGVIVNNTSTTLYIDGIAATSTSFSGTAASYSIPTLIGHFGGISAATAWFEGNIDQVRIYNRAITAEEVTTLYNEVACPSDLNFNTVLYDGNSSTKNVGGVGFQPDLVWIKNRDDAQDSALFDSVRGVNLWLRSSTTAAQTNFGGNFGLLSFDNDGFKVGNGSAINNTGDKSVAWNWKAGGDAVTNTDGTITSDVSANTAAGFSIINYTGASGTVGHSLDSAPQIIFQKLIGGSQDWFVYILPGIIDATSNYYYLVLNKTDVKATTGSTPATATTFNPVSSSGNYIAYAWHSVAGYSKIGTYTGNGSSTGPIVTTGFEPSWLMIKCTSSTELGGASWLIYDNKRSTSNPRNKRLYANENYEELSSALYNLNFTSTGFQLLDGTANFGYNTNGNSYIYMAFA